MSHSPGITVLPAASVFGLGLAVTVAPVTSTVMGTVGNDDLGVASGINNAVARVAGLLAIAIFGLFVSATFIHDFNAQLAALHLAPSVTQQLQAQQGRLVGIVIPNSVQGATRDAVKHAIDQSFLNCFHQ